MRKIISLYQRNYDGDRLVRDEIVPGAISWYNEVWMQKTNNAVVVNNKNPQLSFGQIRHARTLYIRSVGHVNTNGTAPTTNLRPIAAL